MDVFQKISPPATQVLAIDPGPTKSSYVLYVPKLCKIEKHETVSCFEMLKIIEHRAQLYYNTCVIEAISSYGMPVGQETFDTCIHIGQLLQQWQYQSVSHTRANLIYRRNVKHWLCKTPSAKDSNVRQVCIDRFANIRPGKGKTPAIGNKKYPGPLYGIVADQWQALGLAIAFVEGCESFIFE